MSKNNLPPAQVFDLARRCGVKATEAALIEFAALVRGAEPLTQEEMRPAPVTDTLQSGAESAVDLDKLTSHTGKDIASVYCYESEEFFLADDVRALARRATAPHAAPTAYLVREQLLAGEWSTWETTTEEVYRFCTSRPRSNIQVKAVYDRPSEPAVGSALVAMPVPITEDELTALKRFYECASDGEGYDVPEQMMKRLAEIGLLDRKRGTYYVTTDFAGAVLEGKFAAPTGALVAVKDEQQEQARFTAEEICKVRAAKRGMVSELIASGMNYSACGVVSNRLEKLITSMSTEAVQSESAAAPADIERRWNYVRDHYPRGTMSDDCYNATLPEQFEASVDAAIEAHTKTGSQHE